MLKPRAIFAVKGHRNIAEETNLKEISITTEYYYLEVLLKHSGSIETHLKKIHQRSKYLHANLVYYV